MEQVLLDTVFPPTWDGTSPTPSHTSVYSRVRPMVGEEFFNYQVMQRFTGDLMQRDAVLAAAINSMISQLNLFGAAQTLSIPRTAIPAGDTITIFRVQAPPTGSITILGIGAFSDASDSNLSVVVVDADSNQISASTDNPMSWGSISSPEMEVGGDWFEVRLSNLTSELQQVSGQVNYIFRGVIDNVISGQLLTLSYPDDDQADGDYEFLGNVGSDPIWGRVGDALSYVAGSLSGSGWVFRQWDVGSGYYWWLGYSSNWASVSPNEFLVSQSNQISRSIEPNPSYPTLWHVFPADVEAEDVSIS